MKTELRRAGRTGLALMLAVLGLPAAAQAEVIVKGTGEPAFTSSANNTQWVEWSNDGNYRVEFNHHVNGGNPVVDGPYQVPRTGSTSVNWSGIAGVSLPLAEGSAYTICGFGRWDDGTGFYFPDFSTSCGDADRRGLRASTTIDRTAPQIALALAGGAAATRSAGLPLRIDFSDNLAGPFPANFLCVQHGTDGGPLCDAGKGFKYVEQPACSQPLAPGKATAFECVVEAGEAPDGPVSVCAMAADASIPDNPTSSDQRGTSTSANRSAPVCDTVLLDRSAPSLSIDGPRTARVGDAVSFAAEAADATSGLSGAYDWTWGDGTAPGEGASAVHTFTAPGTYEVKVTTADAAGNPAAAATVVTVDGPPAAPAAPAAPAGPATPGTPAPVAAPPAPPAVAVELSAPRRLKLARAKGRVPVTLTATAPGRAALALVRGGRIVAQGATRIAAAGTAAHALKLPRKARAGRHALRLTFTPDAGEPVTRSQTVRLQGRSRPRAGRARAAAARAPEVAGSGARVLPDGRYRGPATRKVALR